MTKEQFISRLKIKLAGLPEKDISERLAFYAEMIDDRIESGLSEEDAIAEVGSADAVASEIINEIARAVTLDKKNENEKLSPLKITLIILGAPLWFPLLLTGLAVMISVYAVIWSLVATVFAIELPFYIFSFISKYLALACKYTLRSATYLTKEGVSFAMKIFKGDAI